MTDNVLLYVERYNFLDPNLDSLARDFYNRNTKNDAERFPGFIQGALYRIERGPECHKGLAHQDPNTPPNAYQYLYMCRLEANENAVSAALRPLEQRGIRRSPQQVSAVYGVYQRLAGKVDFLPLMYNTRQTLLDPKREPGWEESYPRVHLLDQPRALGRPGILRGAQHKIIHGPLYFGWPGPSMAYTYFNLYELENEAAIDTAMWPIEKIYPMQQKLSGGVFPEDRRAMDWISEVRAVYRRIT